MRKTVVPCDICRNAPPAVKRCGNDSGLCIHFPNCDDLVDLFEEKITNADKIRRMSDEELADFFHSLATEKTDVCPEGNRCYEQETCVDCWVEWLKQEVTDDRT